MFVITLITRRLPERPDVDDRPPIASSSGAVRGEDRLVPAGDHGDLARRRLVHAARDRALERRDAALCEQRREALELVRRRSCSCRSRCRRCADPRRSRRRPTTTSLTAAGEGRHVITQSEASATARGEAAVLAPAAARASMAAVARSCTVSGKPPASTRAARWRPRFPSPTKPTFTARRAARARSPDSGSRCSCVPLVRMRERDRLVELDPEPGRGRRDDVAVLPADRLRQQVGVDPVPAPDPLEDQEVGRARWRAGCWRRRRPARSRDAARSARSGTRPCPRSSWPRADRRRGRCSSAGSTPRPSRARVRTRTSSSAARRSRSGIDVARATRAISSGASGGVGSSNQSGSKRSSRCASRIAPETVNCPCVPKSRSQREPTASRTCAT